MEEKKKRKGGRIPKNNKRTHCVMVRFDDTEWARFLTLYEQSGVYAKAVFVKSRVFGEPFKVIKVDHNTIQFCEQLSSFHAQFLGVAVNYNQVVKEADAVKVKGLDSADPDKETNVYPIISVSVAAGDTAITYPTNSINFYGFFFEEGSASVETLKAAKAAQNGATYNVAGQQVDAAAKGLVIKNGKKVVIK
jgi:hypothetical protein